jgi:hypothetical protein
MLRILILPDPGHLWRSDRQASIITGYFKPRERPGPLLLDLLKDRPVAEEIQGVSDGHISLVRETSFL